MTFICICVFRFSLYKCITNHLMAKQMKRIDMRFLLIECVCMCIYFSFIYLISLLVKIGFKSWEIDSNNNLMSAL